MKRQPVCSDLLNAMRSIHDEIEKAGWLATLTPEESRALGREIRELQTKYGLPIHPKFCKIATALGFPPGMEV